MITPGIGQLNNFSSFKGAEVDSGNPWGVITINKKVFAIAPPIIITSKFSIKLMSKFILVETLEPPIIPMLGF